MTVIDAEARQRYRETGMPQKSLPADLSLSLIADDRLAIVDDTPGMWAHELQGRVVRVARAVNASYTAHNCRRWCLRARRSRVWPGSRGTPRPS